MTLHTSFILSEAGQVLARVSVPSCSAMEPRCVSRGLHGSKNGFDEQDLYDERRTYA